MSALGGQTQELTELTLAGVLTVGVKGMSGVGGSPSQANPAVECFSGGPPVCLHHICLLSEAEESAAVLKLWSRDHNISITWNLVRNAHSLTPSQTYSINLWRWGPAGCT